MRCCTLFQLKKQKLIANTAIARSRIQVQVQSKHMISLSLYIYTFGSIFIILSQHPWHKMINKVGCGICSCWSKLCISHLSYKIPSQSCVFNHSKTALNPSSAASGSPCPPPLRWQNYQGATKPKIWISTPSCLIPSTTFCWHGEIKCFFVPKWTWKSYEFSNTLLRRRRGENFRRGSCACFSNVSTQETTCKFKCFHQELKDCFALEARKKIAFKPLHSEKPKKQSKKESNGNNALSQ